MDQMRASGVDKGYLGLLRVCLRAELGLVERGLVGMCKSVKTSRGL